MRNTQCRFCNHESREELESLYVAGAIKQTEIAERIGVTAAAISRHLSSHVEMPIKPVRSQLVETSGIAVGALLEDYEKTRSAVFAVLDGAMEQRNAKLILSSVSTAYRGIELAARLLGLVGDGSRLEAMRRQVVSEVRDMVAKAMAEDPQAAGSLASALKSLEKDAA